MCVKHLCVAGFLQGRDGRLGRHAGVDATLFDRRDKAGVSAHRQHRVFRGLDAVLSGEVLRKEAC